MLKFLFKKQGKTDHRRKGIEADRLLGHEVTKKQKKKNLYLNHHCDIMSTRVASRTYFWVIS